MLRKPIFLDRDGVINVDVSPYVTHVSKLKVFPYTVEALTILDRGGFDIYVISNQQGVALGLTPEEELDKINATIQSQLIPNGFQIKKFYYAKALRSERSDWRKPEPGMIFAARDEFGLDLEGSYFIGDKDTDIECGHRAGCIPLLVMSGVTYGDEWIGWQYKPKKVFSDLLSAAQWVVDHE